MVLFIDRIPINTETVHELLYPRSDVIDDPVELIERKIVLIDTRFRYAREFLQLAKQSRTDNAICGLITNYPHQFSEEDMPIVDAFSFIIFFDEYSLFVKPFAIQAAKRSVLQACGSDASFLPKIASIGYTEIKVHEDNLSPTLIALQQQTDSFNFCPDLSQKAKSHNQYKTFISCPYFLEVKAQDPLGKSLGFKMEGFEARALQHEMDHLDGMLFVDRVVSRRTDLFRRKIYQKSRKTTGPT